ncbi:MAG: CBS domain-containing protein [Thermodesulfobacteriota bacterium]
MEKTAGTVEEGAVDLPACEISMSDDDVMEAMRKIPGYLDITPGDFKEMYRHACRQAVRRILRVVQAKHLMTRSVLSVTPEMRVAEVAQAMASRGVSGVPVVDEAWVVLGVISEKDFLRLMGAEDFPNFMAVVARCLSQNGCVAVSLRQKRAADIMSSPAVTVLEETPAVEIARIFNLKRINRVPVVDHEGRLVGIVSRADILKAPFLGGY